MRFEKQVRNGVGKLQLYRFFRLIRREPSIFSLHAKIISRPCPAAVYTNDTGPFERLCDVWVIGTLPELLASELAQYFSSGK